MRMYKNATQRAVEVEMAIKANGGYCCCKLQKTKDTMCICAEFREKMEDPNFSGDCECGLFHKEA